ncbi:MAG TPA: hypothetical protein VN323_21150 [Candidatus Dormibacteraeota bacterium]|nr:hypothetical protein [Candidatus Dormibacteraeota bacterium]
MRGLFRFAAAALLGFVLGGCSLASQIGTTNPTGIAQQLLVRSLERALGSLDLDRLRGRPVGLEVAVQSGNENFVKDFTSTWLRAHGMRVTSDSPEMKLKLFVSVYGTDRDQTLIGVPAFQAPLVGVPVPELAFFKWVRNRGQAELRLWAFDSKGDVVMDAPGPGIGRAKYDDFTVLLFIGFTLSDVDQRPN